MTRENTITVGTSHFTSFAAAVRYWHDYGCKIADVNRKISEGLIHIGKPALKAGDVLTVIDGGTRYAIMSRVAA